MRILLIHQNFPGQFKHLAPALVADGHEVRTLTLRQDLPDQWQGVTVHRYRAQRNSSPTVHPWVGDFETKVIRGEACFRAALQLRDQGYQPDLILAHPGWGETLFLQDVWPAAKLAIYCEFYYRSAGSDVDFDPEFQRPQGEEDTACRLQLKNLIYTMQGDRVTAGIAPTHWQADQFPEPLRSKITVVHDGIDTEAIAPNPGATITLNNQLKLGRNDEVITFVNRNLEPYRGYHIFMRSLPEILQQRPKARVILVGGDDVSYGARPPAGTWKQIFLKEVADHLDLSRVHFVGKIPYNAFLSLLQVSSVHVYLTYPFVLSWSLIEAMSCGCAIVASDTAPVREVISDGETGRLVNFFDPAGLAATVSELLASPSARAKLGKKARLFAQNHYDLQRVCLPQQMQWVRSLA
ncbi:glycosyltransferase family 4 protein [Synechococcus elongatus]|uniref:glycosyltransferase family 4 protein n=1 Tax=Synechococcus elongatus TaxID=32046 RepID=UPI000F7E3413|nr:glycosyltransferase family 4 protein [Synechococcus elongatus]